MPSRRRPSGPSRSGFAGRAIKSRSRSSTRAAGWTRKRGPGFSSRSSRRSLASRASGEAAAEITKKATTKQVTVRRVEELERQTRHDLMAVVLALTEACSGDAGKYVHLGATSNDIQDSATALQIRDAIRVLDEDLAGLIDALADLAMKHKKTIMLGRTHGQAAVPITFGLKMAVFASEVARQRERLREVAPRIVVGKMSGAVGTGAAFGPRAMDIQSAAMSDLGIGTEEAATQVVGRDRHAEFI